MKIKVMKFIKLLIKIIFGIILFLLLSFLVLKITLDKKLPKSTKGQEAEQLAHKMLNAINFAAWDTLSYVKWNFRGDHHYVWDRTNNTARISWGDFIVHINLNEIKGRAYKSGERVSESQNDKFVKKAWAFWCNDSFWFNAPAKIFDEGTERSIVHNDDGSKSLLVKYESGGVTPGDSYLWETDEAGLPKSWRMWTKIIPIKGVYTSWEQWIILPGGAKISSLHKIGKLSLEIGDIKGAQSWEVLGFEKNPINL